MFKSYFFINVNGSFVEGKDCQYFINQKVATQLGIDIPTELNATMIGE